MGNYTLRSFVLLTAFLAIFCSQGATLAPPPCLRHPDRPPHGRWHLLEYTEHDACHYCNSRLLQMLRAREDGVAPAVATA